MSSYRIVGRNVIFNFLKRVGIIIMNDFADMVSKEVRCSLANDFWSKISCGDYVELYLVIK